MKSKLLIGFAGYVVLASATIVALACHSNLAGALLLVLWIVSEVVMVWLGSQGEKRRSK
jgi:hypothetical protein